MVLCAHMFMRVCICACLCAYVHVSLSVCFSVLLSRVFVFVCVSVCAHIYLYVCLIVFLLMPLSSSCIYIYYAHNSVQHRNGTANAFIRMSKTEMTTFSTDFQISRYHAAMLFFSIC